MGRFSYGTAPNPDESLPGNAFVLFAMSCIVLLIACLNLANMFLARGASRRAEIAIRHSLGSGRARLVRQLMVESLLLALLGGVVGLIVAYGGTRWIAGSFTNAIPLDATFVIDMRPDLRVLLVTAATCCIAATLLFGLGPAWRVTGTDVLSGLKEGTGAISAGTRRRSTLVSGRSLVIVAQIALSLVMLMAGGLFVRSTVAAASATPTFSLDSTLVVKLDPSLAGYDEARSRDVLALVLERLRALPEVENAGMASHIPFGARTHSTWVQQAGAGPDGNRPYAMHTVVSDGFFDALRLPMLRGRDFVAAETSSVAPGRQVAIIDEPLARRLFPDGDALGRRIELASSNPDAEPAELEIIGVAPGTPGANFDPAPTAHVYLPYGQDYTARTHLVIGVDGRLDDAASLLETIRHEIAEVDPLLPVLFLKTMREVRNDNDTLWLVRLGGRLFALFGLVALFLAMVGLYGVKAFLMSRRTREIGVRMALGATRGDVLRQMMRESIVLTGLGLAVGLVLALAAGRVLSSLLYDVSAADPWIILGAMASLALGAAIASWLPVDKALRAAPITALRHE